jgi:hypothetical protein
MPNILVDIGWILGVFVGLGVPYLAGILKWSIYWYGTPTLYFFAFFVLRAELLNKQIDVLAAIFFGVLLTACGWLAAKYEHKRW